MTIQNSRKRGLKVLDTGSHILLKPLKHALTTLVSSVLVCSGTFVAAQQDPGTAPAADQSIQTEEITTYPEMSLRKLRLEINNAQQAMFNVFNDLNSDDRFDIHCGYVKRWQSRIRKFECGPVYLATARQQEAHFFLGGVSGTGKEGELSNFVGAQSGGAGVTQMDHFNAILESEMNSVFEQHVEFREAMNQYQTLQEIYSSRVGNL